MSEPNLQIEIPYAEFNFTYSRSSGPGGQNVNKVNSKTTLHWDICASRALEPPVVQRFLTRYSNSINVDGCVVISSDRYRDQIRNREDCIEKLYTMLKQVLAPPKPRKKSKPSRSSKEKAAQKKRFHGEKKKLRRRVLRHE